MGAYAKVFNAASDVPAYRIVKAAGSEDAALATSSTDKILGISPNVATAAGNRLDVILEQVAELKLGGTVENGDPITSDANGCGIKAEPDPGETLRIVGGALVDGVADDIIRVKLNPGFITG